VTSADLIQSQIFNPSEGRKGMLLEDDFPAELSPDSGHIFRGAVQEMFGRGQQSVRDTDDPRPLTASFDNRRLAV
jgi:hypothetical protein